MICGQLGVSQIAKQFAQAGTKVTGAALQHCSPLSVVHLKYTAISIRLLANIAKGGLGVDLSCLQTAKTSMHM